ncbi:hypothetical protein T4D_6312 [Trichinella pseudospiralis]|uniref:Uncharacterized protein n=1 Tax=Trichinella pseudospiralis TaxID=6337 RepID=A0A0V1FDB2_TRIPS|nr:hypothetical protein T4D_6312 [Trichinella pseudospiralis]
MTPSNDEQSGLLPLCYRGMNLQAAEDEIKGVTKAVKLLKRNISTSGIHLKTFIILLYTKSEKEKILFLHFTEQELKKINDKSESNV